MPLKKRLEKIILFNGQSITEVKNSRIRRVMINTIERILTDKALTQSLMSQVHPVYNLITQSPGDFENIICDTLHIHKDAEDKIQKIYFEQLRIVMNAHS